MKAADKDRIAARLEQLDCEFKKNLAGIIKQLIER